MHKTFAQIIFETISIRIVTSIHRKSGVKCGKHIVVIFIGIDATCNLQPKSLYDFFGFSKMVSGLLIYCCSERYLEQQNMIN